MENTLHPEALKAARKKKGWSQRQLAENSRCSIDQISRWERGISLNMHPNSRGKLIKALGISWEVLTRPPTDSGDDESKLFPTVQLNLRVRPEAKVALILASRRYNVRPTDIIELAPLLFLITAEKSLADRQANIDAIDMQWEAAVQESIKAAPHLAPAFFRPYDHDETIESELQSIMRREVFGPKDSFDVEEHNPYVTYLVRLIKGLPEGLVEDLSPNYFRAPDYRIAEDTLREITGISGKTENDQELLEFISQGDIDLRELLNKKQKLADKDYSDWLSKQREDAKTKREEQLYELLGEIEL